MLLRIQANIIVEKDAEHFRVPVENTVLTTGREVFLSLNIVNISMLFHASTQISQVCLIPNTLQYTSHFRNNIAAWIAIYQG
jgi:hypothetical protein